MLKNTIYEVFIQIYIFFIIYNNTNVCMGNYSGARAGGGRDDWKLCRVFPDDVIIHPLFDWSAGKVHLWFDKVVDSVMCHLLLHVIYVGYEAELTLI